MIHRLLLHVGALALELSQCWSRARGSLNSFLSMQRHRVNYERAVSYGFLDTYMTFYF